MFDKSGVFIKKKSTYLSHYLRGIGAIYKRRLQLRARRGQNCQRILLKNCWHGGGGVKNPKKLPTLFMEGPIMKVMSKKVGNRYAHKKSSYVLTSKMAFNETVHFRKKCPKIFSSSEALITKGPSINDVSPVF